MKEQKKIEETNQTQQPQWLVNNILFCYEGETHTGNDSERKQEVYTDGLKSTGRKVGFATVFADIISREALAE